MFIFVLKQHRSTHAPRLSGVSPVSPSVPEILEGYVSTIAEPFKVFKCYPPSNCLSKKWYFFCFFGGDCGFFGRVGFKIVIGSIFGISWPASAATNFAFNKGTCNKMSKRPTPMRKGIPFKKKTDILQQRIGVFGIVFSCFLNSSFLDEKTAVPRLLLYGLTASTSWIPTNWTWFFRFSP